MSVEGAQSHRSAATAFRWVDQWRCNGSVAPKLQGGDNRSHRIKAYAVKILALIDETPDITLSEIAAHLEEAHGLRVAQSTVWRLLDRHDMTLKKNRARRRARAA